MNRINDASQTNLCSLLQLISLVAATHKSCASFYKRMKPTISPIVIIIITFMLFSCSSIPKGVTAIHEFDKNKYLGKWHEIARLDFKFERNLINTTAQYSVNADGTIKVVNRGYDTLTNKWKSATGKAKFVKDENVAMLKVSFLKLVCNTTGFFAWAVAVMTIGINKVDKKIFFIIIVSMVIKLFC